MIRPTGSVVVNLRILGSSEMCGFWGTETATMAARFGLLVTYWST